MALHQISHRKLNVLVVDDELELRSSLSQTLRSLKHSPFEAESAERALEIVERNNAHPSSESPPPDLSPIHLVFLDVNLPGMSGLEALREILRIDPTIMVVIITAHGSIRDAVEAMRDGAYSYLEKPVQQEDVEALVHKASEANSLVQATSFASPSLTLDTGEKFIGKTREMRAVFEVIQRLGRVNTSVFIRGENGTGKELVARAIHFNSPRKDKPFVAVNCGAIPEALAESEFFGHEKGAFTGADQRHIGKFQFAEGGTLFLDEIGEISPAMQVKLLRVIQERKFTPLGSNREIKCDVRIIAATNQNLEERISKGDFRQDLFYRLNVVPIQLPALRERREDIPTLVDYFINKFNQIHGRDGTSQEIRGIREDALDVLKKHNWPGNIRELENVIERAFVLENSNQLTLNSLPEELIPSDLKALASSLQSISGGLSPDDDTELDYSSQKAQFERQFIINALRRYEGKINQTVAHAKIPKNTLLRKIRKYEIQPWEYGGSASDLADEVPDDGAKNQ